jgi:hypothetical protein
MSANLATSSWTTAGALGGAALLAEPANARGAHAAHALDLGLHGRGHHTGEYLRVDGGRGGIRLPHCLGRAASSMWPRPGVPSAAGHRVGCLAMPKAAGFAPLRPMPVSGKPWLFCGAFKTEEAGDLFKDASLNPDTDARLLA